MTKVDFSDVSNYEVIPSATYGATLNDFSVETAQSSGQPYVKMSFKIVGGEHENRLLWSNYSLQPKALWALKKLLVDLGTSPEVFETEFEIEDCLTPLVGSECSLVVIQQEYEGVMRNAVHSVSSRQYSLL